MSTRPHFKWAVSHRIDCGCKACRMWRAEMRAARILDRMR